MVHKEKPVDEPVRTSSDLINSVAFRIDRDSMIKEDKRILGDESCSMHIKLKAIKELIKFDQKSYLKELVLKKSIDVQTRSAVLEELSKNGEKEYLGQVLGEARNNLKKEEQELEMLEKRRKMMYAKGVTLDPTPTHLKPDEIDKKDPRYVVSPVFGGSTLEGFAVYIKHPLVVRIEQLEKQIEQDKEFVRHLERILGDQKS